MTLQGTKNGEPITITTEGCSHTYPARILEIEASQGEGWAVVWTFTPEGQYKLLFCSTHFTCDGGGAL